MEGVTRNVYFHQMDNGWTAILTIPEEEILSGVDTFNYIIIALVLLGLAFVIFQAFHDYRHEKQSQLLMEERDQMADLPECHERYVKVLPGHLLH